MVTTIALDGYSIAEQIHVGTRTLVFHGVREADQAAVVIKFSRNEFPQFNELSQFRNQYTLAKGLNLPGVIKPYSLERYSGGYALVMEDFGGISLRDYCRRLAQTKETIDPERPALLLDEFFPIALQLTDILDELYRHRIVHKDIKPSNILIHPQTKQVKLIDFSIASLLPRESQEIQSPGVLEGTLAYLSPEQTGRMNRGIDYRTDYYSLGITFYELLAGQLPFASDDPMELVHCHIARQPPPLQDVNCSIPVVLSDLVARLIAKNAEDRYQSALGLKHDLQICWSQWQNTGQISAFALGQRDASDRFLISEKLYGREQEVAALLAAFERVAGVRNVEDEDAENKEIEETKRNENFAPPLQCSASPPHSELILLAGFSGVGKTAVVNEVHKPIARGARIATAQQRGYFIQGKFDQFQRNIPFSAFVQAFRDLMGQLLSESNSQLAQWQTQIMNALGENGQVMINVVPELEYIIGQQSPVPELTGSAAENRFNLLFQKFIQVFTTQEHPLVIFLDDLQWADLASLKLMQLLMSQTNQGYLLLIGAYRENEVNPAHPLMLTLDAIRKTGAAVQTIALAPLRQSDIQDLITDTLSCSSEITQPLTELIYRKAKGNPFFTTQFLRALHEDGLITFDLDNRQWQCNMPEIAALALTDDVVEFMALQLQKLPALAQTVLKLAACIGNQFDLETLATVYEKSQADTAAELWSALKEGFVIPISDGYKFYQTLQDERETTDDGFDPVLVQSPALQYRFLHDRVQQAAYLLIPENQKQETHWYIGQRLLRTIPVEQREDKIFAIVDHLNRGTTLTCDPAEQKELVQLNLSAAHKAIASTAYASALRYCKAGQRLLAPDRWKHQYDLTLALYETAVSVAFLSGEFEQMEQMAETVLCHARTLLDKVKVYEIQIQATMAQNQPLKAVHLALAVLKLLDIEFPDQPAPEDFQAELEEIRIRLGDREIEDLIHLPLMTDPHKLAVMRIIAAVETAAYFVTPALHPLMLSRAINLSIQYGNTAVATFFYAVFGQILCGAGELDLGFRYGQLAMKLLDQLDAKAYQAKVVVNVEGWVTHWKKALRETLRPLLIGYQSGLEAGDLEATAVIALMYSCYCYCAGMELTEVEQEMASYHAAINQLKQETLLGYQAIWRQAVLNLLGKAADPCRLIGEAFDEQTMLPHYQASGNRGALFYIDLHRLMLNYWFGNYEAAIDYAIAAEQYLDSVAGMLPVVLFYLYEGLARLAIYPTASEAAQEAILARVETIRAKLNQWAEYAPMNHLHKVHLLEAERYRALGHPLQASEAYDRAIALAKANQYLNEEALATELAAQFYLSWGRDRIAQDYLISAYYSYTYWGAKAKVQDLERRYPKLLVPILQQPHKRSLSAGESSVATDETLTISSSSASPSSVSGNRWADLDLTTILRASQTLSSEIQLDKLLSTLLQIVIANAGAEKCVLMLMTEQQLAAEAIAEVNQTPTILQPIPLEESQDVPVSLINIVKRTLQPAVILDATTHLLLMSNPYVLQRQPRSILCTPILHQGKLLGVLYLENNQCVGAFTHDRVEVLNLLCTQAAISLENARLYQQSQQALKNLKQMQLQLVQSEKMSALGNLVSGIAHEINNPVGFLAGNLQPAEAYVQDIFELLDLYQQSLPDPDVKIIEKIKAIDLDYLRDDLPKLLNSMKLGIDRIRTISTSLRTFSRADKEHKVHFNIHDGIDSTLLILKHRLKANDQHPEIEVIRDYGLLPSVACFPGQLNQVFMNILANAIDALEESNAGRSFEQIQLSPNQITIRTRLSDDENHVQIQIKDNGIGMPDEVRQHIFDHLFTTKAVGKGTGLGLAIAHQIVIEKHGGTLEVRSSPGAGAEFIISIPMTEDC